MNFSIEAYILQQFAKVGIVLQHKLIIKNLKQVHTYVVYTDHWIM